MLSVSQPLTSGRPCKHCGQKLRQFVVMTESSLPGAQPMFRKAGCATVCPRCDGPDLSGSSNPPIS